MSAVTLKEVVKKIKSAKDDGAIKARVVFYASKKVNFVCEFELFHNGVELNTLKGGGFSANITTPIKEALSDSSVDSFAVIAL